MQENRHLVGLGRLRGLAVLCVVFGHSFHVQSLNVARDTFNPLFLIVGSGTVIFVVIAGVLFQTKALPRLLGKENRTRDILRRRWSELSGIYLTIGLFLALVFGFAVGARNDINPLIYSLQMMLNGSMAHSYWYVPFFLLLMAFAPLHVWYCRKPLRTQVSLFVVGVVVSAFVHRPAPDDIFAVLHSLVYFLPVFWFGLLLGASFKPVLNWLHGKESVLGSVFILVMAVQMRIGQDRAYLHEFGQNFGVIDLFVVQKIVFALFFLSVLHRTRHLRMNLLDWLSRNSLTTFFMHSPVLLLLGPMPHLSGFYLPELVLVTTITILGGVHLHGALVRTFAVLPSSVRRPALAIKEARFFDAKPTVTGSLPIPSADQ
ncbi:MAG: acyltransferase [Loktanella sp.]|nr:acyltransferase [Loktanella sp.]